jgi:hypothetical protein
VIAALHAHHEVALLRTDGARGQLQVLARQRRLDIGYRQRACRERVAIEPDAHRVIESAAHLHAGHAVDHREAVGDEAVGVIGELQPVHAVADQVEPQHHASRRVLLADVRRIGFRGQLVQCAADAIAHVVRRIVDVALERELELYQRHAVLAARADGFQSRDAGDAFLERLRDARFHHGR